MLDGKQLGQKIWAKVKENLKPASEKNGEESKQDPTEILWEAVGEAICAYFKENAEVKKGIKLKAGDKAGATTEAGKIE